MIISVAVLVAGAVSGYLAFKALYSNKLSDSWGIMYLELERQGLKITNELQLLQANAASKLAQRSPGTEVKMEGALLFRIKKSGSLIPISGNVAKGLSLVDLGLGIDDLAKPNLVARLSGKAYLAVLEPKNRSLAVKFDLLHLFPLDLSPLLSGAKNLQEKNYFYLTTREGELLYASNSAITKSKLKDRSLVRFFIDAPLNQGQVEMRNDGGDTIFGFFSVIPNSNLVAFAETPKSELFMKIYDVSFKYLAILFLVVICTILVVQIPLNMLAVPIRRLINSAVAMSQGNFSVPLESARGAGLGEIAVLGTVYAQMIKSLKERDLLVSSFNEEQKEKIRLDGELKIARGIQENLLPKTKHPVASGFEVTAKYVPATEVAGDWYHFWYSAETGETVIFMADVSGHGAGSSMFTAIIAGAFKQMTIESEPYPVGSFLSTVNRLIYELGDRQWHASVQIIRLEKNSNKAVIYNAGHPPPVFVTSVDGANKVQSILMASSVLGLSENADFVEKVVTFHDGDCFLMYTDGLFEAKNREKKSFGRKRLLSVVQTGGDRSSYEWVEGIHDEWLRFRGDQAADDDLCVVAIKAVA
jgi:serine phosphatase RsbU (regulator of sigma subunit)